MYRVLVVDDEPSICKALEMGLSPEDFEVDVSTDGNGGILLGSQRPYDILIADLCLPDMDGLDVIREIKRISPEIIPIVITGNGSMESSIEAIHLEVSDYLEKPLTMESVKSAITRGIEKRAMKRKTMRKKLQQMLEIYKGKFSDLSGVEANTRNTRSDQLSETIPMFVHQINNPLMSIVGSAELGMLKLSDTNAVKQYFADIIEAVEKINTINKKIIKLQHPSEENIERLDIGDIINDCLNMFKDLMTLKEIPLEKDQRSLDLPVFGNKFGLEQLFNNLILNAIDSMDGMPEKRLKIWTEVDENASMISVYIEDTGCGIPKQAMDKIFTPYFTSKKHGTGLGLSVVKGIVERHAGKIHVESEAGKGTRFKVNLPAINFQRSYQRQDMR